MTDELYPQSLAKLAPWIFGELEQRGSVFGIPRELFFQPVVDGPLTTQHAGRRLETPIGVAAGPHSQLAPNLVSAWLCGARFLELKTVQTLERLEIARPCIDLEDVGYNCEWSQELALEESLEQYLVGQILITALRERLGHPRAEGAPGFVFDASVGYDLKGIQAENVQRFLARLREPAPYREQLLATLSAEHRWIAELELPEVLADSVTLSTMHGCPPEEIERIGRHLIEDLGFHTTIKLNPTLLGPELLRELLHGELGYDDVEVPDEAFAHDPTYAQAVRLIEGLRGVAAAKGLHFGLKLSNTLETRNLRRVLPESEALHYLSGRALHPLTVVLAAKLAEEFAGEVPISFSAGADAFNVSSLVAAGLGPVTAVSDLLKPGGCGRLAQYLEELEQSMAALGAKSQEELALVAARARGEQTRSPREAARANLAAYADEVRRDPRYHRSARPRPAAPRRSLGLFDCIAAPCVEGCPAGQNVPDYLHLVAEGRERQALEVVLRENPLPSITGRVCDHPCTAECVRGHYDAPLAIRRIKRYLAEAGNPWAPVPRPRRTIGRRVAVVGAGPAGLVAAHYAAGAGLSVTVFDAAEELGGVPARMIPSFRLPDGSLDLDLGGLATQGIEFQCGRRLGVDLDLAELEREGFGHVFLALGALRGRPLRIEGEGAPGVYDCLELLQRLREGASPELGSRVVVIGGGNSAFDAARAARRAVGPAGSVAIAYRRTLAELPAAPEEIEAARLEGIAVHQLRAPRRVLTGADGRVRALATSPMQLGVPDASGRPRPVEVPGAAEELLDADSIVVAVGQSPDTAFLAAEAIDLAPDGRILTDPATTETSRRGVFAGGDAVRGSANIIGAVADGRRFALEVLRREGIEPPAAHPLPPKRTAAEHLVRRSRRVFPELALFAPTEEPPLTEEEARREAGRCLACDERCSLCVTVCPNRANQEYETEPFEVELETLTVRKGEVVRAPGRRFRVRQATQIVNLADLCNECGNCATFCPTTGAPYRDKPRLCFGPRSFEREENGYLLETAPAGWSLRMRRDGEGHTLVLDGDELTYRSPILEASLDPSGLAIRSAIPGPAAVDGVELDLEACAVGFFLARSLLRSADFLPLGVHDLG